MRRWMCALVLVAGCATPEMRVDSVSVASRRLAALPTDGEVIDFDFNGHMIANPGDTATATRNFDDAINYRLRQHGGRAFQADAIDNLPHAYPFRLWVHNSLREIRAERLGRAKESHDTVGDWRFSSSLGGWRPILDADFILISLFVDGRNTPGREAAAFTLGGPLAVPDAIACVVHLETARIVWCNHVRMNGDLTLRAGAQADVDSLLDRMLFSGDGAQSEPPSAGPAPPVRPTPLGDPGPAPSLARRDSKHDSPQPHF